MWRVLVPAVVLAAAPAHAGGLQKYLNGIAQRSPLLGVLRAQAQAAIKAGEKSRRRRRPRLDVGWTPRVYKSGSRRSQVQSHWDARLTWRIWDWSVTAMRIESEARDIHAQVAALQVNAQQHIETAASHYITSWHNVQLAAAYRGASACMAKVIDAAKRAAADNKEGTKADSRKLDGSRAEVLLLAREHDNVAAVARARALIYGRLPPALARPALRVRRLPITTPAIARAIAERRSAELRLTAAERAWLPKVTAEGQVSHSDLDPHSEARVGVRFSFDLFDNEGRDYQTRTALGDAIVAAAKVKAATEQLRVGLKVADLRLSTARTARARLVHALSTKRTALADAWAAVEQDKGGHGAIIGACRAVGEAQRAIADEELEIARASVARRRVAGDLP